jgi:hypothetical protein
MCRSGIKRRHCQHNTVLPCLPRCGMALSKRIERGSSPCGFLKLPVAASYFSVT